MGTHVCLHVLQHVRAVVACLAQELAIILVQAHVLGTVEMSVLQIAQDHAESAVLETVKGVAMTHAKIIVREDAIWVASHHVRMVVKELRNEGLAQAKEETLGAEVDQQHFVVAVGLLA